MESNCSMLLALEPHGCQNVPVPLSTGLPVGHLGSCGKVSQPKALEFIFDSSIWNLGEGLVWDSFYASWFMTL